jgi:hypothetical protein
MLNELLISIAVCKLEIWEHLKVEISLGVVWNWNGWNSLVECFFEKKVRYIHMPSREATILTRAMNINHEIVNIFSENLPKVLDKNKFEPHIFNTDK